MSLTEDTTALDLALRLQDINPNLSSRLQRLAGAENRGALLAAISQGEAMLELQAEAQEKARAEREGKAFDPSERRDRQGRWSSGAVRGAVRAPANPAGALEARLSIDMARLDHKDFRRGDRVMLPNFPEIGVVTGEGKKAGSVLVHFPKSDRTVEVPKRVLKPANRLTSATEHQQLWAALGKSLEDLEGKAVQWDEGKHPRDQRGLFASKPGGGQSPRLTVAELRQVANAHPDQPSEAKRTYADARRSGASHTEAMRQTAQKHGGGTRVEAVTTALDSGDKVDVPPPNPADAIRAMAGASGPVPLHKLHVDADHGNLFDKHSTNLKRAEMPQVPGDAQHVREFEGMLKDAGIKYRHTQVAPMDLHATQAELDGRKVGKMASKWDPKFAEGSLLFIDHNGNVLDGHHRWAAASTYQMDHPDYKVNVVQVDANIQKLLELGWEYDLRTGTETRGFGT